MVLHHLLVEDWAGAAAERGHDPHPVGRTPPAGRRLVGEVLQERLGRRVVVRHRHPVRLGGDNNLEF